MLDDKDASSRRALKQLLDEASEPIPTAGATITNDGGGHLIIAAHSTVNVVSSAGLKELAGVVIELAKQIGALRDVLLKKE
jgi:HPt (histidine-containing phosphotransfer) domain-containing protein